jgi:hypothetical protein
LDFPPVPFILPPIVKRSRRILLAASLAIAVGILTWRLTRPKEPEYQGKPISYWVDRYYHDTQAKPEMPAAVAECENAFRQMGTNAVPHLIRMLGGKNPTSSFSHTLTSKLLPQKLFFRWHDWKHRDTRAANALEVIGPNAELAIPALIEKLGDFPSGRASTSEIGDALVAIGPKSAVPLGKALFREDFETCSNALIALWHMDEKGAAATPYLIRFIQESKEQKLSGYAIQILGIVKGPPETVVPFLIGCLNRKSTDDRAAAATALAESGSAAKSAVPALLECFKNDEKEVAKIAAAALKKIDPQAAAQAGIK